MTGGQPIGHVPEIRHALLTWAEGHLREFPWRGESVSTYEVLVAEVLLKRTTARAASRVFPTFIARFPDLDSIRKAAVGELEAALEPVGLYRQRARGFKEMAEHLVSQCQGMIPDGLPGLLEVPHLGPYSARAVLSFGYGIPTAIVDSNVQRVLGRVYSRRLGEAPSVSATQVLADLVLDAEHHKTFNWAILDLGAMVCRYDKPKCHVCPLVSSCDFARRHRRAGLGSPVQCQSIGEGQE